jgi:RHS repeat-associated protein
VETVAGTSHTYAYSYDPDGQLTKVTRDGTTVERYAYDQNGNRISVQPGGNPAISATYDAQDRLQQQGSTIYSFDADGYLTRRGSDTFSYNARGELVTATVGGQTVGYAYDGLGRRVGRTDGTGTTSYLYGNPNNPFQVTAVRDPSGTLTTLIYDAGGLLIAVERGGTRYYVSTDLLGTPRVVVNGAGHVLKTIQYDSFGNVTATGGGTPDFFLPIGFAGGLTDAVTGLVHFGFRDYDPIAGRWTARDPSLYAGGQGNLYVYVGNDPVGHYDPLGLFGAFGYQIQLPGWASSAADWVSSKASDWLISKVDSVQTGPVTWSVNAQERTVSASTSATLTVDGQAVVEAEVEGYVGITRYTDLHCPLFKAGVKASWKQKLAKIPGIGKWFSGSIQREVEFGQVQDFTDPNVNTEFRQLQQVDYNGTM